MSNSSESINDMIESLFNGDKARASQHFQSAMVKKVNEFLDQKKVEVAGKIYNENVQYSKVLSPAADAQFDLIEEMVNDVAESHGVDPDVIWEDLETVSDEELIEAAVDSKGHKSSTGGLTQKGRDHYNRETGSDLKAPVTTPPSKLKKGSKAANRRKSFCARMSGVKGPMKKPNGKPTRKALALRKWNC